MKVGVITFPGSNCDRDLIGAWNSFEGVKAVNLWHKDHDLQGCGLICLPGGFSYGDYLRSGAIARFSPVMQEVVRFAEKGGYLLGICNGFQILTESGLLPGALRRNQGTLFIHSDVYIKPDSRTGALNSKLEDRPHLMPIAHAEGNYYCDEETLKRLEDESRVLFRYCDAGGRVDDSSNPNGSLRNIAGVCSSNGRVCALMPHPERAADPLLNRIDGRALLESLLHSIN